MLSVAAEFLGFGLAFQLVSTICFSSKSCREACTCHTEKKCCGKRLAFCCCCRCKGESCLKVVRIIHGAFISVFSTLLVIFQTMNFNSSHKKYDALEAWSAYSDCVDDYMKITEK